MSGKEDKGGRPRVLKKPVTLNIQIEADVYAAIAKEANRLGWSRSALIRSIFDNWIAARKIKNVKL